MTYGILASKSCLLTDLFTPFYLTSKSVIVTKNASKKNINSLADIRGKRVGVYTVSSALYYFRNSEQYDLATKVEYYDSLNVLFTALDSNNIDAIFTDEIYALAIIKNSKNSYKVIDSTLNSECFAVAFPINKNNDVFLTVSSAIDKAVTDGTIDEISKKWFGKNLY